MEEGSGCGLQDTSRHSNDPFSFLCNLFTQGDISLNSSLGYLPSASDLVVSANIEESKVGSTAQENLGVTCEIGQVCSSVEGKSSEEDLIENIAQSQTRNSEIVESRASTCTEDRVDCGISEEYINDNICKTISEIASNPASLITDFEMSRNRVLEAAMSMSNITPSSSSTNCEFLPIQAGPEPDQQRHLYQDQNWDVITIGNECNATSQFSSSGFAASRQNVAPPDSSAPIISYSSANLGNGYNMQTVLPATTYEAQHQYPQQADDDVASNLNQFFHNSQLPLQNYQPLRTDKLPAQDTQELSRSNSAYNKGNAYNQAMSYNPNSSSVSLPPVTDEQTRTAYDDSYLNTERHFTDSLPSKLLTRCESGEDNALEDRSSEKKLTTTPIPSDADKMSSSGSSVSSGSLEESLSPGELEADAGIDVDLPVVSTTVDFSNFVSVSSQDLQHFVDVSSGTGILMTDSSGNCIPAAENIVEIDETLVEYNTVETAPSCEDIPVSPSSLPGTDHNVSSSAPNNDGASQSKNSDIASPAVSIASRPGSHANAKAGSWSVLKEERQKRRLEKKFNQAKLLAQQSGSRVVGDETNPNSSDQTTTKQSHHRHKHKHHVKHHSKERGGNVQKNSKSARISSMGINLKHYSPGNPCRGVIPKVTADPTSGTKTFAPKPKSITEKVKQQLQRGSYNSSSSVRQQNLLCSTPAMSKITLSSSQKIAPRPPNTVQYSARPAQHPQPTPKPALTPTETSPPPNSTTPSNTSYRWQTVTALQGPKLPPILSERDRIPKRGRPSKKMTELNLKLKAENQNKSPESLDSAPTDPATGNSKVSMYTISESGCIQAIEKKPIFNQRCKERALAFQNMLSEISKKTSIQNKTAGAKDVVSSFNAVGMRTRNQSSVPPATDIDKKKHKAKSKAKPAMDANAAKNFTKGEVLDDNAKYTFSELAQQFKISNSILFRAMEQSQRNSMGKKGAKALHKHKEVRSAESGTVKLTKVSSSQLSNSQQQVASSHIKHAKETDSSSEKQNLVRNVLTLPPQNMDDSSEKSSDQPSIKLTSLSSEKSADLQFTDVVKRKKKKKKHKKEKDEGKKKKKDKERRKKLKKEKRHRDFSDSAFSPETNNEVFSEAVPEPRPENKVHNTCVSPTDTTKRTKDAPEKAGIKQEKAATTKTDNAKSTRISLNRSGSLSSLSAGDDAYDAGDSSSDPEPFKALSSQLKTKTISHLSATTNAISASTVFGSCTMSALPSFQGIKEHGGLLQFSEHAKSAAEATLSKTKKHKHKKKKVIGRGKSVSDPEFLIKVEKLVQDLEGMKLSPGLGLLTTPFSFRSTNVFATPFEPKRFRFPKSTENDSFSYRDPSKQQAKSKKLSAVSLSSMSTASQARSSNRNVTPESSVTSNMSVFCKSDFFSDYGLIKPLSEVQPVKSMQMKSFSSTPVQKQSIFAAGANEKSGMFGNSSESSSFLRKTSSFLKSQTDSSSIKPNEDGEKPNTAHRSLKRKRGWPRGKPRGPRVKKPLLEIDPDSNFEEVTGSKKVVTSTQKSLPRTSSAHQDVAKTSVSNSNNHSSKNHVSKSPAKTISSSTSGSSCKNQAIASAEVTDFQSLKGMVASAPINQELLDHIKAAVAATFTSAELASDTVAKTVDRAVVSYLQRLNDETDSSLTGSSNSSSSDFPETRKDPKIGLPVKRRGRGRPPKLSRETQPTKVNEDACKASEKHPKKVWASLHEDSSKKMEKQPEPSKKRGPGRPRKLSADRTLAKKTPATPQSVAEATSSTTSVKPKTTLPNKSRRPDTSLVSSSSGKSLGKKFPVKIITKKGKRRRRPNTYKFNNEKNNSALLKTSTEALKKQNIANRKSKSAAALIPSLKMEGKIKKVQDSRLIKQILTEANGVSSGKEKRSLPAGDGNSQKLSIIADSTSKGGPKKSLELVVAKLKSKQNVSSANASLNKTEKFPSEASPSDSVDKDTEPDLVRSDETTNSMLTTKTLKRSQDYNSDENGSEVPAKKSKNPRKYEASSAKEKTPYLKAGLLSSTFKRDSDTIDEEDADSDARILFPPPEYDGEVRKTRKDFQLPYDFWKLYDQQKISPKQNIDTQFITTKRNLFFDASLPCDEATYKCDCLSEDDVGCRKKCLNRSKKIECSPETCPCGEKCRNRVIQNQEWLEDVDRYRIPGRGWTLRATTDIAEGKFLMEYVGEIVSESEFRRRMLENYNAHKQKYYMQFEAGKIIDASRVGNESRFINHSCQPNCEVQKWLAKGQFHLCIFSKQPIKPGDELTCDYALHVAEFDKEQTCRCGSPNCREIIGLKSNAVISGSCVNKMAKAVPGCNSKKKKTTSDKDECGPLQYTTIDENSIQPNSAEEEAFIKHYKPFLMRNLVRIKQQLDKARELSCKLASGDQQISGHNITDRGGAQKNILLYDSIKKIFNSVMSCKDDSGVSVAIPFINLRSKQQTADHHSHIEDPVDLSFVDDKIETNQYEKLEEFSGDLLRAFRNAEKFYGKKSPLIRDIARLRRVFASTKNEAASLLGETNEKSRAAKELKKQEQELDDRRKSGDYIRCICGIYKDEGTMIQCEKCYVWQHCDCMQVDPNDYSDGTVYLCEECDGRDVLREVKVVPQPPSAPPGHTYYLTLLKDNLLIKQGACVRLIHDHCLRHRPSNNPPVRSSYRLQSHSTADRMDFFRIKKLWTDDSGDKFAYGCHFLRPQDTKNSESRLFFTNELIATTFHEIVPLEAVVSLCCVMDLETFRKGKPKDFKESDIYICQHKADLSLRIINKVTKNRYPMCTKPHVFTSYPVKLVTVRDYQVPDQLRKTQSRRTQWLKSIDHEGKSDDDESSDGDDDCDSQSATDDSVVMEAVSMLSDDQLTAGNDLNVKQRRLNGILSKLLKDASSRSKK